MKNQLSELGSGGAPYGSPWRRRRDELVGKRLHPSPLTALPLSREAVACGVSHKRNPRQPLVERHNYDEGEVASQLLRLVRLTAQLASVEAGVGGPGRRALAHLTTLR